MNNKVANHLIFAIIILPLYMLGGVAIKWLLIPYFIFAIFKKDATYLPAIVLLGGVSTNLTPVFLGLFVLSIIDYKNIAKNMALQIPLIILIVVFPVLCYFVYEQVHILGAQVNHAIGRYSAYLSLFGFFYGCIISKTCNEEVWKGLIVSLLILSFLSAVNILTIYARLLFAFAAIAICMLFFAKKAGLKMLGLLGFIMIIGFIDTFTFYFTIIASFVCCYLYRRNNTKALNFVSGPGIWVFTIFFFLIAMIMSTNINIDAVSTGNALRDRFTMKLIEDRGLLWNSIWFQILTSNNYLPPIDVDPIVANYGTYEIEYEIGSIHEHNIYLHCLRNYGYIIGVIVAFFYVHFVFLARKVYKFPKLSMTFILLISSFVANYLIGGATGNYVTDMSFSLAGMTVLGIAYNKYKEYENSSLVH